jgi:hypothetical protein
MEVAEILNALERNTGTFPRAALEAAVERREEITPELLRILEYTVANAEALAREDEDGSYFAYLHAMYLLAQFRETRAYPLVVQFARLPEAILSNLVSDFITEGLELVLASVCGGDTTLIETLIEDPNAEEYARGAGIHALLVLVAAGNKSRDEVMEYFKTLFDGRLERSFSEVWNALVDCATKLYPDEMYDRIVAAYDEGLVEPFAISLKNVDDVMSLDRQTVIDRLPKGAPVYIQDVIEEMEWWACFDQPKHPRKATRHEPKRQPYDSLFFEAVYPNPPTLVLPAMRAPQTNPVVRRFDQEEFKPATSSPKVKPNERCPCDSGKKFKKCCGRLDVAPGIKKPRTDESIEPYTTRGKVEKLDPRRDAEYIIKKAQNAEICIVGQGALVYFATDTGDAWMLDVEDHFALCLARDGERQPFRIVKTNRTYHIEWTADYQIDDETFTVFERSGRIRRILGYPMDAIRRTIQSIGLE